MQARKIKVDLDLVTQARSYIYRENLAVKADKVEELLKPSSLSPSKNAFAERLSDLNFDLYSMLVVDLLHEFELGVWQALFIHLIRLLHTLDSVNELDIRYHQVPRFGQGAIRKFSSNVSELKKLAAHNFEDLLQCAMPVFDGLFPSPHNELIQKLLFTCAHWHALAKLRMHTDITVNLLEGVTVSLGELFREFVGSTCTVYATYELPRELDARVRKETRKKDKHSHTKTSHDMQAKQAEAPGHSNGPHLSMVNSLPGASTSTTTANISSKPMYVPVLVGNVKGLNTFYRGESTKEAETMKQLTKRKKTFNLSTYKFHALGDYPAMIKQYGTCDSYSTEPGELEHRTPKARYRRTSKKGYIKQIAQIERRQAHVRQIRARMVPAAPQVSLDAGDDLTQDFNKHYHIGKSENQSEHIGLFYNNNLGDPAVKEFIPCLKKHLLPRIRDMLGLVHGEGDWERVTFHRERMYAHRIMRVNFTRYDIRRGQDVVRTGATPQSNIMMLNPNFAMDLGPNPSSQDLLNCDHPFWYAQVLGIYHVNAVYLGEGNHDYQPRRIEYLWIRWYDIQHIGGWQSQSLDQVTFPSPEAEGSFAFLDPDYVLRACHMIPYLHLGRVLAPGDSGISHWALDKNDYKSYTVNRFADRDMMLRYHWGAGIGHTYSWTKGVPSQVCNVNVDNGDDHDTVSSDDREFCDDLGDDIDDGKSDHSMAGHGDECDDWWEDELDEEVSDEE
ncbi:hypothetical protein DXG01_003803 [Tephrocybe rancida]|nr:hypothetical protein DXG01_003803 [Tephrocybe rancida]